MFTIKAVSQATGVSIETLRAWERRYRVVEPNRDPNGRRSYEPQDVIRLRKLREATERGHAISKLARFSDEELSRLLTDAGGAGGAGAQHVAARTFAEQMLAAAEHYRPDDCDQALSMALALLPLTEVVAEVLAPVLLEVGERWHSGAFNVAQERLVTSSVRKQVSSVLETYNRITDGPPIVLATLSNERHEIGILLCALLAAARGVRCQYLGPDVPPADIAIFADKVDASAVVLSFVLRESLDAAHGNLAELTRLLPRAIPIWIGGLATRELDVDALGARVTVLPDYPAFERQLATLAAPAR